MRGWTAVLVGTLLLLTPTIALAFEGNNAQLFAVETEAQKDCPADVVVWVNIHALIKQYWIVVRPKL